MGKMAIIALCGGLGCISRYFLSVLGTLKLSLPHFEQKTADKVYTLTLANGKEYARHKGIANTLDATSTLPTHTRHGSVTLTKTGMV